MAEGGGARVRGQDPAHHAACAAAWGRQHAQPLPVIDELIAATAKVNGLTVVTWKCTYTIR
jgi:predicted nucleic acid-binding protein